MTTRSHEGNFQADEVYSASYTNNKVLEIMSQGVAQHSQVLGNTNWTWWIRKKNRR